MIDALEIRRTIQYYSAHMPTGFTVSRGQKGAVIGKLNTIFGDDANRHLVLGWIFSNGDKLSAMSTRALTINQWYALYSWIGFWKDEDENQWHVREELWLESVYVLTATIKAFNDLGKDKNGIEERPPEYLVHAVELGGIVGTLTTNPTESPNMDRNKTLLESTRYGRVSKKSDIDLF